MTLPRAGRLIATAATASTTLLLAAGPAGAAPVKGLQDQDMTVNHPTLAPAFFSDAASAGVRMSRYNTRWDGQASTPDLGQLAGIKAAIQAGARSGITAVEVSPNISGDASFNPRGRAKGPTAASKISATAYTSYIRSLATALKGSGVALYYAPINEPNWYRHIPKRGGAALYRKLHNIAYQQIKAVDPSAKVLFGELLPYARALSKNYPNGQSTNAGSFTREVLGLNTKFKGTGSKKAFTVKADGVSLHTYDFKASPTKKRKNRDEWTQANLGYAKADLKKAAKTGRISTKAAGAIYLTEFAYKTTGKDELATATATKYLKSAWTVAKQQKVRAFVWYQLRDPQATSESWQSGLKTREGGLRSTWTAFQGLK